MKLGYWGLLMALGIITEIKTIPTMNYNWAYQYPPSDTTTTTVNYAGSDLSPTLDLREKPSKVARIKERERRERAAQVDFEVKAYPSENICRMSPYHQVARWNETNDMRQTYNRFEYSDKHDWEQTRNADAADKAGIC